jgi:hypothetical protein
MPFSHSPLGQEIALARSKVLSGVFFGTFDRANMGF